MKHTRTFAIASVVALVMLLGAGAVFAYDASRSDVIADGVRVKGVDVGGLRASEARVKLRQALLEPLRRAVVVRHGDRRFKLTAARTNLGVDVDGSVDAALDASRDGGLPRRAWRALTGASVDADVPARVSYASAALDSLVRRVRRAVDRPAVDATLDLSHGRVDARPARNGVRVRTALLRRDVRSQLLATTGPKTVRVHTRIVRPKVTRSELRDRYPAVIIVSRGSFKLELYKHLELAKTYSIAVGQAGLETPAGLYHVQNKAVNPAWHVPDSDWAGALRGKVIGPDDPQNPIKARWLGIYDGAGIHGTDAVGSIGTAASHGCIRMRIPDVVELYDDVPVGAPVYIS